MNRRAILTFWILLANALHVTGQSYYSQIVIPQLFSNVYMELNGQKIRYAKCILNDTLHKEMKVGHLTNGSIMVNTFTVLSEWETHLIYDNSNRIKEFGTTSDFGANHQYYYDYIGDTVLSIEYFEHGIKKWNYNLTYAQDGRIQDVTNSIFHGNDSLVEEKYDIHYSENQMIIAFNDSSAKYFFNDYGQCESIYFDDKLTFRAEYSDNGRVLSETYYWASIDTDDVIFNRDLFFYDDEGNLLNKEIMLFHGGELSEIICCDFYSQK